MKIGKSVSKTQRKLLDDKFKHLDILGTMTRPRSGWLKSIRGALGLSAQKLASRLQVDKAAVMGMEDREIKGAVTLATLDRAARAMNCRLIYAIVPEPKYKSLEAILDERALLTAQNLTKEVDHSMKLEGQGVEAEYTEEHIQALAKILKDRLDPKLWEN